MKMMKRLVSVVLLLLFTAGCSCNADGPASAIREVLRQHRVKLEELSKKPLWEKGDPAEHLGQMVSIKRSIDLSGCPQDFQIVWNRHVTACMVAQRDVSNSSGWVAVWKAIKSGGSSVSEDLTALTEAQKKMISTWSDVQEAAIKNGVTNP